MLVIGKIGSIHFHEQEDRSNCPVGSCHRILNDKEQKLATTYRVDLSAVQTAERLRSYFKESHLTTQTDHEALLQVLTMAGLLVN